MSGVALDSARRISAKTRGTLSVYTASVSKLGNSAVIYSKHVYCIYAAANAGTPYTP